MKTKEEVIIKIKEMQNKQKSLYPYLIDMEGNIKLKKLAFYEGIILALEWVINNNTNIIQLDRDEAKEIIKNIALSDNARTRSPHGKWNLKK